MPATFVSELLSRFDDLPREHQDAVRDATANDIAEILRQAELATDNAALAASGTARIEAQVAALRSAIADAESSMIIKFPGALVSHDVVGDGDIVVGEGSINIKKVDMR